MPELVDRFSDFAWPKSEPAVGNSELFIRLYVDELGFPKFSQEQSAPELNADLESSCHPNNVSKEVLVFDA
jgi:hypothetical protein